MRILLLGEASNLHWTLGEGLRALGHDVTVASHGGKWHDNRQHILLRREPGLWGSLRYMGNLLRYLPAFRNFDVVQVRYPVFLHLRPEKVRYVYDYLRRHNKKVFLGAFGTDYHYVKACEDKLYKYSDFYIGEQPREFPGREAEMKGWTTPAMRAHCQYVADTCNGIAACLYEYYVAYEREYREKLAYLPIPIDLAKHPLRLIGDTREKVRFFLGIQGDRSELKGTDIYQQVLRELHARYPNECEITEVISVPLEEYLKLMRSSDVILDQLYSYTPATNALQAMAQGLAAVSGGEPEFYDFIGEKELRPIINTAPDPQEVYRALEEIVLQRESLPQRCMESRAFVEKHHSHIDVARQYLDFWEKH